LNALESKKRMVRHVTNVRFGSLADIVPCRRDVRFTPESGHWLIASECPLCANSGLMHCSNDSHIQRRTFATKLATHFCLFNGNVDPSYGVSVKAR
jgi:hypothetical protein